MVELFNPIAQSHPQDIDPVGGLEGLRGKVISLLSNTHPGVDPFMDRLQDLLEQRAGVASVLRWRKETISRPMPPELKAEIAAKSHAVITGVGTWGSCTSWSVHDGVQFQLTGLPAVVVCTTAFGLTGKARAKSLGMPRLPQVLIKHPIAGEIEPVIHSRADDVFDELLRQLQARHAAPVAATI